MESRNMANLTPRPNGNFSYLPGSGIYCRGAVADPGFTLVHATLQKPAPLAQGFALIQQHLAGMGRLTSSLCGLELRIAQPLTFDGFGALSASYIKLLDQYALRDGVNATTTRTNVAIEPAALGPKTPSIYGFTYTVPGDRPGGRKGFIGSGIGELTGGARKDIVLVGKTSPRAMREKAKWVMGAIGVQMKKLGVKWQDVSVTTVYTALSIDSYIDDVIVGGMGPAARYGVHWIYSHPPIKEIEFEIDIRGTSQELFL